MIYLLLGVLLWSGVHLFPCLGSEARSRLIGNIGERAPANCTKALTKGVELT